MDSYQAVYDATRSRINPLDTERLIQEIASQFDFSFATQQIKDIACEVMYEYMRPCVVFKPKIYQDGNEFCALLGEDIQVGIAGFGKTPKEAMAEFDKAWDSAAPNSIMKGGE